RIKRLRRGLSFRRNRGRNHKSDDARTVPFRADLWRRSCWSADSRCARRMLVAASKADYVLMSEVLGLIPARGGSRSIPKKNIALLCGRPLLAYTCEAALESRRLTRVVLSTDDEEVAKVGRDLGVDVPFLRSAELAEDDTPSIAVVEHCLKSLAERQSFKPDVVVLLQPTSPLRAAHHIDEALDQMEKTNADTVVSVMEVPHHFSPYSVMRLELGWLRNFWQESLTFDRYRRQEVPILYA